MANWLRWNDSTRILELSTDLGGSWAQYGIDATAITQGLIASARLGTGGAGAGTKVLADNQTFITPSTGISLADVYPVGSIYINAGVSTSPATLFGFGTWAAFGTGRVLVGIDTGQTEFDTLGETGGSKTHTLAVSEMPAHAHPGSTVAITDPGHVHRYRGQGGGGATTDVQRATDRSGAVSDWTNDVKTATTGITAAPTIASQGGGGAHNNLQPYIVVYMWQRTA